MLTKQVLISLFIGVALGATMVANWNPWVGVFDSFRTFMVPAMADAFNAGVFLLMGILGGFAGVIERNGGATAFGAAMARRITSARSAQIWTWVGGLGIWFSAMANAVVLGPIFRPITDRVRISREKLAWILDCTAVPVPILIPITGWGAYIIGLLAPQFDQLNILETELAAFVKAIPFQLYPIAALILVPFVAITALEFGAMKVAERRAREEGKLMRDGAKPLGTQVEVAIPAGAKPSVWDMGLPMVILVACVLGMFAWTGGFPGDRGLLEALGRASAMPSLTMAFFIGTIVAMAMGVRSKVLTWQTSMDAWMEGVKGQLEAIVILVLAFAIARVSTQVGTASYLVGIVEGVLSPELAPLAIFLVTAFVSFATGTSWGTYAIFIPVAIPLAAALDISLYVALGAVLSGGLWGDHVSPISDTCILASIGATCDHMDHVKTQLVYALVVGFAVAVGFLVAGFGASGALAIAITLAVMFAAHFVMCKVTDRRDAQA
jgi:Na+/H+ antiporter NhaC